jgi:hypothetical protein
MCCRGWGIPGGKFCPGTKRPVKKGNELWVLGSLLRSLLGFRPLLWLVLWARVCPFCDDDSRCLPSREKPGILSRYLRCNESRHEKRCESHVRVLDISHSRLLPVKAQMYPQP